MQKQSRRNHMQLWLTTIDCTMCGVAQRGHARVHSRARLLDAVELPRFPAEKTVHSASWCSTTATLAGGAISVYHRERAWRMARVNYSNWRHRAEQPCIPCSDCLVHKATPCTAASGNVRTAYARGDVPVKYRTLAIHESFASQVCCCLALACNWFRTARA
jgi:hypothetical protein